MITNSKKMVIALDYNPTAQMVAEEGFALATAIKANITLVHVISDPINYTSDEHITIMGFAGFQEIAPYQNDNKNALINESKEFLKKSKEYLGDYSIRTIVKEGDIAESILEAAIYLNADIIVMGSHSSKWQKKINMGSVIKKVLGQTTIPLFIVPTRKAS